jgi:hypothetical protein
MRFQLPHYQVLITKNCFIFIDLNNTNVSYNITNTIFKEKLIFTYSVLFLKIVKFSVDESLQGAHMG